jgi:hypothetical protein
MAYTEHDLQTCVYDSISCRNIIFLHPVSVICSVTFEVISRQQDFCVGSNVSFFIVIYLYLYVASFFTWGWQ